MIFRIALDVESVQHSVDGLSSALDLHVKQAMATICDDTASDARANHTFRNRTGRLDASIRTGVIQGDYMAGSLEGEVRGDTEYAEYVDERPGYEFLQPAYDRVEPHTQQIIEAQIQEAITKAGW